MAKDQILDRTLLAEQLFQEDPIPIHYKKLDLDFQLLSEQKIDHQALKNFMNF